MKSLIEKKLAGATLVVIAALAISACATTSDGLEFTLANEQAAAVTFHWQGSGDGSGTLTADLTDGRQFSGPDSVNYLDGKALASLSAVDGERLRCQFRLAQPASGMEGGGEGKCELADGTTLSATLPPRLKPARA